MVYRRSPAACERARQSKDEVLRAARTVVAAEGMAGLSMAAHAQSYPQRPIKIIVAYAAGQGTDIATRYLAAAEGHAAGGDFFHPPGYGKFDAMGANGAKARWRYAQIRPCRITWPRRLRAAQFRLQRHGDRSHRITAMAKGDRLPAQFAMQLARFPP